MRRRLVGELMDDPRVPRDELEKALRYIRGVNLRLGGVDALLRHLKAWSADWDRNRPITLLDIATGSADLPVAARRWAVAEGFDLRITGVDLHQTTLDVAREFVGRDPAIELLRADALTLNERFAPGSFDYVHAGLFLHHLPDQQVLDILRSMDQLASAGIIWNDLVRSRIGHTVIFALTLGKPRIIAHDARASVAAGFTKNEVLEYADRAGIRYAGYSWDLLSHRFTLAGQKNVMS